VTVGVVNLFEIINVYEKKRHLVVVTDRVSQFGLQGHLQISSVANLCKRIQKRQLLKFVDAAFVGNMGRIVAEDLNGA